MSIFKSNKISLTAKTVNGGSFPPNLKPDLYNGNPQLFILTGIKKGEGVTYLRAGLEVKTAGLMCEIIEALADRSINTFTHGLNTPRTNTETEVVKIECKSGKEKEIVSEIVIGKTPEGKMFLSVVDKKDTKAPIIQFFFGTDLYHPVHTANIEGLSPAMISCLAAKSWAKRTRDFWYQEMVNNPEVPQEKGGNNKGGYGKSDTSSFDNDAPW